MADAPGEPKLLKRRTTQVVVVLVAVLVAAPALWWEYRIYGPKPPSEPPTVQFPGPMGSPEAPVTLRVFVQAGDPCHESLLDLAKKMHRVYGDQLRIVYTNISVPEGARRADQVKLGCNSGFTVDDKLEWTLKREGKSYKVPLRGPPGEGDYAEPDLWLAVNTALAAKKIQAPEQARTEGAKERKLPPGHKDSAAPQTEEHVRPVK